MNAELLAILALILAMPGAVWSTRYLVWRFRR